MVKMLGLLFFFIYILMGQYLHIHSGWYILDVHQ